MCKFDDDDVKGELTTVKYYHNMKCYNNNNF